MSLKGKFMNQLEKFTDILETGDRSNTAPWLILMGISGTGAISMLVVCRKQRKRARHSK